jgi:hypothetical protein
MFRVFHKFTCESMIVHQQQPVFQRLFHHFATVVFFFPFFFLISKMNHTMKRTLTLFSILQITVAGNDLPTLFNDTLNQLVPDNSNTADGIAHIITALSTAVSLSISFFKYLFAFVINVIQYLLAPFGWLVRTLWSQLVAKPFALFLHVMHILYPVLMFCAAAIGCGLFIGGCAGFAAEAFSNLLITATWGPQPKEQPEEQVFTQDPVPEPLLLDVDTEDDEPNYSTTTSSFFGAKKSKKARGKEPMHNSSNCSSRSSSPPVMIRRMKLSSTETPTRRRKNSWQWDEDEEDEEPYHYTDDGLRKRKTHL